MCVKSACWSIDSLGLTSSIQERAGDFPPSLASSTVLCSSSVLQPLSPMLGGFMSKSKVGDSGDHSASELLQQFFTIVTWGSRSLRMWSDSTKSTSAGDLSLFLQQNNHPYRPNLDFAHDPFVISRRSQTYPCATHMTLRDLLRGHSKCVCLDLLSESSPEKVSQTC